MSEPKENGNDQVTTEWMTVNITQFEVRSWFEFLNNFGISEDNYFEFVAMWKDYGMKGNELI